MDATGELPETDVEGYLIDPLDWNEGVAEEFARRENITLTEDHWDAIRFMRDYYMERQIAVDVENARNYFLAAKAQRREG